MRHHVPKAPLAKERDYIMIEARSFFGDLASLLSLLPRAGWPQEAVNLIDEIQNDASKHDLRRFHKHTETSRQLAWKYMKTSYRDQTAFLLMLTTFLDGVFRVDAKKPDSYDLTIRPKE